MSSCFSAAEKKQQAHAAVVIVFFPCSIFVVHDVVPRRICRSHARGWEGGVSFCWFPFLQPPSFQGRPGMLQVCSWGRGAKSYPERNEVGRFPVEDEP